MANLIKVVDVEDERGYNDIKATIKSVLEQVFHREVKLEWNGEWQGVEFKGTSYGYSSPYRQSLQGIQMTVGDYGERTLKRVMVKNGYIDADKLIAKFTELKTIATELAERRKESENRNQQAHNLLDRVAREVNHPNNWDCPISLHAYTPDKVKLEARVNGTQLVALETLLGEQGVRIKLEVPADKAVGAYKIMRG